MDDIHAKSMRLTHELIVDEVRPLDTTPPTLRKIPASLLQLALATGISIFAGCGGGGNQQSQAIDTGSNALPNVASVTSLAPPTDTA